MKEPKLRYNSHNKHDLRDPYPVFYYSMLKFIDSLPGNWFFDECIPFDYDGYSFVLTLHDGKNHKMHVSAVKLDGTYRFTTNNS